MTKKVTIRMSFINGRCEDVAIAEGGDWRYTEPDQGPLRLVIRPQGDGCNRHEFPLCNIIGLQVIVRTLTIEDDDFGPDGLGWTTG